MTDRLESLRALLPELQERLKAYGPFATPAFYPARRVKFGDFPEQSVYTITLGEVVELLVALEASQKALIAENTMRRAKDARRKSQGE